MTLVLNRELNKRKIIVRIAILLIIACVLFLVCMPLTHAFLGDDFKSMLADMFADFFSSRSENVKNIFMNDRLLTIVGVSTTFFSNIAVAIKSAAMALFGVKVFIQIFQAAGQDRLNMDFVLKCMVKIAVMCTVIANIDTITISLHNFMMKGVIEAGWEAAFTDVQTDMKNMIDNITNLFNSDNGVDILAGVGFVTMLIRMLITRIIIAPILFIQDLLISIAAYSLVIEIGVRRIFMPLALLGIMDDGPQGAGVRYLKKYAGVYIKMAIYVFAFALADYLAVHSNPILDALQNSTGETAAQLMADPGTFFLGFSGGGFQVLMLNFAAYGLSKRGETLANDVMGVN